MPIHSFTYNQYLVILLLTFEAKLEIFIHKNKTNKFAQNKMCCIADLFVPISCSVLWWWFYHYCYYSLFSMQVVSVYVCIFTYLLTLLLSLSLSLSLSMVSICYTDQLVKWTYEFSVILFGYISELYYFWIIFDLTCFFLFLSLPSPLFKQLMMVTLNKYITSSDWCLYICGCFYSPIIIIIIIYKQ